MKADTPDDDDIWPTKAERAAAVAQARALRAGAKEGGLRFEAYLPPALAEWLLERIEQGAFHDPSEAVFVLLGEHKDLEPHQDLREELLRRRLQASIDDPRPAIPGDEVFAELRKKFEKPRPEPARWVKRRDREVLGLADMTDEDVAALKTSRSPESAKRFDGELDG